jgi:DNA-binding transcriptional MerR regulator
MTIQELANRAQVTTRTIRYYVEQGVLPPPERGRPAEYTEEHLARLALIKRLKEQYLPLEEIRDTMQRLSLDEVEALVAQHSLEQEQSQKLDSAADYITTVLGRGMVREQMKQAAPAARDDRASHDASADDSEGRRLREAVVPYHEPLAVPPAGAPPAMATSSPVPAGAAIPPPAQSPQPGVPAPGLPAGQASGSGSLASRLWSSVVGGRAQKSGAAREESATVPAPTSWQRVQLGEGIELHYVTSTDARFNNMVSRLIDAAHRILDEGPGNGE